MNCNYFKITKDVLSKINCAMPLKFEANVDNIFKNYCNDTTIRKLHLLGFEVIIFNDESDRETICLMSPSTSTILSSTDIRLDDNEIRLFGNTFFTSVDFADVYSHEVTNMAYMFYGCENLTEINVSNLDTSSSTDM